MGRASEGAAGESAEVPVPGLRWAPSCRLPGTAVPTINPRLAAALDVLIEGSRRQAPSQFPATVAESAALLGADAVEVWVQDYSQQMLIATHGETSVPVDGTAAGEAFALNKTVVVGEDGRVRLWLPLRDGAERLGVLGMAFGAVDVEVRQMSERFASVVAEMLLSRSMVTDVFARLRRTREMGLAAEMQWELLPPLTFAGGGVALAGILEPAYTVGGDAFDYAFDDLLRFAVFDAMGHGVEAAISSAVAIGAYRHARRRLRSLTETYVDVDAAVAEHRAAGFVTAVFAELDPRTGSLRWLNAGHPYPRLLRGGVLTALPRPEPVPPCGLRSTSPAADPVIGEAFLEADDRLLLMTDGAMEQTNAAGEPFGEGRLVSMLAGCAAEQLPAEESLRRVVAALLAFATGNLRDDVTVVLVDLLADDDSV